MKLPKFDKSIPVSPDINRPNRYGYTRLYDVAEDYSIKILRYDENYDSHYCITKSRIHSIYINEENDMLYAELESSDGSLFYAYLSLEIQNIIKGKNCVSQNETIEGITSSDCYLAVENYIDNNKLWYRYVIDIYYQSYHKSNNNDNIEKELNELVDFFRGMQFDRSAQISNYIRLHKIGYKFKNISGFLEMSDGTNSWIFEGGIAPCYYKELCRRLGLANENSQSFPTNFESYKEHNRKK